MKKVLIIIGIILVVVIAALALLPVFFKQPLLEKTKTAINRNVNAEVEFKDLKLSLFRSFPKLTVELVGVSVKGQDEFSSDTLLWVPSLRARTSLAQLFKGEQTGIEEIILDRPFINLIVGKTGNANWDIVPEGEPSEEASEGGDLELKLEKIEIIGGRFIYDDREVNMLLDMADLNFDISGEMYGSATQLVADGGSGSFTLNYEGTSYISAVSVATRTVLNVDYEKMDIAIQENELLVNRLPLEVTGLIQMPDDTMYFDLQVQTKESGFDNFLALVPPEFEEYLQDFETRGTASVSGSINGYYYGEDYPAFNLQLDVADGNLHYTSLPNDIRNISADVSVVKPQGILDSTRVDISRAHAEVQDNPVDMSLRLRNLVSDPYFDGRFTGNVNLTHLKNALPLDSVNMAGVIDANLLFRGNYSSIENEDYENIKADGNVALSDFIYEAASLTQKIEIPDGNLIFSPQAITLNGLTMNIGQSNFSLTGKITNYLNYAFQDGVLAGNLQLNSPMVNMNELMHLQAESQPDQEQGEEMTAFDIPANIDITFNSNIKRVIFDRVPLTQVNGLITARNERLALDNLSMQALGGNVTMTGSYQNTTENQPVFDFGFNIKGVEIQQAFQTFSGLRKIMPIAGQSQGNVSTDLKMKGQLTSGFKLIAETVNGGGKFSSQGIKIVDSNLFSQLKGLLKADKLRNVALDDFTAALEITNGTLQLKPFKTRIAGQEATIAGNLNTQNLLDLRMDFVVQREAFGSQVEEILSALPGQEKITQIPASVTLKGAVEKPDVNVNLDEARKQIVNEVKNKIGDGLRSLFK